MKPSLLVFLALYAASLLLAAPAPMAAEQQTSGGSQAGNQLVRRARQRLVAHQSIQAKLRQRVDFFGQTLVGTGSYSQLRRGDDLLFRLDLKLQMGERMATCQQVADGRFLWIYRDLPDLEKLGSFRTELQRLDLDLLRRAVQPPADDGFRPADGMLGLGGLPWLLQQLEQHFQFEPPQPRELHGVPVWTTLGRWRAASLQTLYDLRPGEEDHQAWRVLQAPLPHDVLLTCGQDDLFPYRVEYRRRIATDPLPNGMTPTQSVLLLELFELQVDAPLDVHQFERRAGDLPVVDRTESFLQTLLSPADALPE